MSHDLKTQVDELVGEADSVKSEQLNQVVLLCV